VIVEFSVARKRRLDLALEQAFLLSVGEPPVALDRKGVALFARDAEQLCNLLSGLAHVHLDDGVGQAALEPDDRLQITRPHLQRRCDLAERALRGRKAGKPAHALLRPDQRRVAQRLGAAGEDQVGAALADVAERGIDRLHARAAIDLFSERHHPLAHAETKRGHTRRIHLVGDDVDATEDHLVEGIGRERLARQERPSALHGKIDRGERPRAAARLQERGAGSIDNKDWTSARFSKLVIHCSNLRDELRKVKGH
jgi:hypothetical protein